jgi:phosphatidylserine/phosphatidylglycerophosphate/cardiolipin synthase-like enzyme
MFPAALHGPTVFPPTGGQAMLDQWLLLATGFTGALTLVFLARRVHQWLVTPPAVAVYFSPKGGCTDAVVSELRHAHREVLVLAYSFTSQPIAQALLDAKRRGVHVEILLDRSNEHDTHSDMGALIKQGLTPHVDAQHAIAHNKVMIIDRRTVITGSFNFTHQAEAENAENLLVIKGHPQLVSAYRENFAAHKAHSQAPGAHKAAPAAHRKAA